MARFAEILGDRLTLLILREAFYGVVRYDDILADLGGSRSMLTNRLSALVAAGLMERISYREPLSRARQAYKLTSSGRALGVTLIAMSEWAESHLLGGPAPVEFVDKDTGEGLAISIVDRSGRRVPLSQVKIRIK